MGRDRERDSNYFRLTGLWATRKSNLFTGKLRNQDIGKAMDKLDEAEKDGKDVSFFLWENDKGGRKDPIFTLQMAPAEEQQGGGRGRSRSGRDNDGRDNDRDNDRDRGRDDKEDKDDKKEPEKEARSSRRGTKKEEPASRGRSSRGEKKDDNW